MGFVALCAEDAAVKSPELLGLDGEALDCARWLRVYSEARQARQALAFSHDVEEVWVAPCNPVDPINLAAAIKRDAPTRKVFLVSFSQSGSLMSRANSAGIDGVLNRTEFVGKYLQRKQLDRGISASFAPSHAQYPYDDTLVGPKFSQNPRTAVSLEEQAEAIVKNRIDTTGFKGPVLVHERADCCGDGNWARRGFGSDSSGATAGGSNDASVRGAHAAQPKKAARDDLPLAAASSGQAFLLPVVSGSGGSGKSAVAATAAILAQHAGLKTVLIDLDLQFGDMKEMMGVEEALHVEDLLEAPIRLKNLFSSDDRPDLLTIPRNLEQSEEIIKRLPELLNLVRPYYDVIVVNTGSFWSDEHVILLEQCSRALFLVDQRPSSLRACQRALDLCTRCGIATSPLVFVINKCSKGGMYSSIDVSCALHGAISKELMWGGSEVEEYLAAGQAKDLVDVRNAFVSSLGSLLGEIIPAMPQAESERPARGHASLLRFLGID